MKQVIPVVVINDEKETIEILSKLREGGINCAEITFRTACAKEAIAIGTKAFEDMNIGAGTVINAEQAKSAVQAADATTDWSPSWAAIRPRAWASAAVWSA